MNKFLPLALLALLSFGGVSYYLYNKPHKEAKDTKADIIIEPAALLAEYEENEEVANSKYLDKLIKIKGTVKTINNVDNGASVSIDTGNELSSIICEFEDSNLVESIKVGDMIEVKGFCTGKLMDIILIRCSITE